MFDQLERNQGRSRSFLALSLAAHAAVIAGLLVFASARAKAAKEEAVRVAFVAAQRPAPPPPPPPPARRHTTPTHHTVARVEIPKVMVQPKVIPAKVEAPPPPPVEEEEEDEGDDGGVDGGVVGGVKGGVLGGVVGGTGTGAPRPKPRNVPAFAMAREAIQQDRHPRLSEVFRNSHVGQTMAGIYKVCVDLDGHVYDVSAVRSIAGADAEILNSIRESWLFKPQKVPVCFLYNYVVTLN